MSNIFVYDLIGHMRRDDAARKRIVLAMQKVEKLHASWRAGRVNRSEVTASMAEATVACGFNVGMLMPYFFHNFRDMKPMSFLDRPYMFTMTSLAPDSVTVLMSGRQVGKCADGETDVDTSAGVMTLQELFDEGVPSADEDLAALPPPH